MTELEGYYCGLCRRLMPISHFPHSAEKRVTTMTDNQEMTDLYGPAATFAEHKRGDRIRYTDTEHPKATGTIIWICAPTAKRAMQYVVEPDRGGFPDFIAPGDVIEVLSSEPTMQKCPFCFGSHYDVEACPLNPNRRRA